MIIDLIGGRLSVLGHRRKYDPKSGDWRLPGVKQPAEPSEGRRLSTARIGIIPIAILPPDRDPLSLVSPIPRKGSLILSFLL